MRRFITFFVRLATGVQANWIAGLPTQRQKIYFANHTSHLDFVVIWSALSPDSQKNTRPVAAKDYWSTGSIRPFLAQRVFNAVLVERQRISGVNPLTPMIDALGKGFSLIIFPEGTRSPDGAMQAFKSGLYHLAIQFPDVELVPVYLDNLNRMLPKGEFLPVPMVGSVTFGTTIRIEENETKPTFLLRARQAVESLGKKCSN